MKHLQLFETTAAWANNVLFFTFAPTGLDDCVTANCFIVEVHCHCYE